MAVTEVRADRRKMILTQCYDILKALTIELSNGVIAPGNFVHNRNELPKELVPGVILLDADEVWDPLTPNLASRGDAAPTPGLLRMTPEVYVVLDERLKSETQKGNDLNTARAVIIGKMMNDTVLQHLVGANGQIRYDGCVTDFARNRTMQGQIGLSFTFVYPFVPAEFALKT